LKKRLRELSEAEEVERRERRARRERERSPPRVRRGGVKGMLKGIFAF
jgi:hypothetical protein